jgi:hypothetical protein
LIVLAGEFTLWFNINFEGESRAELDFREAKCEIWESTCQLASLIIDVHSQMQENQKEILTKFWWEHVRFASFGQQIAGKLNADPKLK